jgi:hypothetical protein
MSRRLILLIAAGVVTVLIGAAVVVAASGGVSPTTAPSKASSIATTRGSGTVPYDVLDRPGYRVAPCFWKARRLWPTYGD